MTIVSYNFLGDLLNEAILVVENIEVPVTHYTMTVEEKKMILLSGVNPSGEYIVRFVEY